MWKGGRKAYRRTVFSNWRGGLPWAHPVSESWRPYLAAVGAAIQFVQDTGIFEEKTARREVALKRTNGMKRVGAPRREVLRREEELRRGKRRGANKGRRENVEWYDVSLDILFVCEEVEIRCWVWLSLH